MIKQEDYPFILYNNRSVNGVVNNFVNWPEFDSKKIVEIEKRLSSLQAKFNQGKTIGIERKELNKDAKDITYSLKDIQSLTDKMNNAILLDSDREWLNNRGITDQIIDQMELKSLSCFTDKRDLEILGCTVHPLLGKILEDGIEDGGIMIPLYKDDKLINCTVRKLSDIGKLKYTQSCPDLDVWGLETLEKGKEAWITEGIFDAYALINQGAPAASVSSAMWSSLHLYKILEKEPSSFFIFSDNDQTGLRCSKILQLLFNSFGIPTQVFISKDAKDPAEHFLEKGLGWDGVEKIDITKEMIMSKEDQTFNFTKYLKTREF